MTARCGVVTVSSGVTVEHPVQLGDKLPVVAVVDAHESTAVVWWVDTAGSPGLSRLCGAWVLPEASDEDLDPLLWRRHVLATAAGHALLRHLDAAPDELVNPAATRSAVHEECRRLQRAHEDHVAALPAARHAMTPPVWPKIPDDLDPSHHRAPGEDVVALALGTSRWMASLCAAWKDIETERLKRRHLRPLGGTSTRDLPLVLRAHVLEGARS